MIDRRPALIARCAGVSDVIAAVRFARTHRLLVSVKGGGHNITGNAVCEGGLMIDLSPMKGMWVDPVKRIARAQAGLTWGEFNRETQAFGLATTGGVVSTTGIAGLTLGGGLGWLMGSHGLSCDNLLSADLITADGEFLTASAEQNSDLFWGLRGGGGNFGVVTAFEYRLHPVTSVLAGMVIHPMEKAREVLRFYREFCRSCPDEVLAAAALMTSPEGMPVAVIVASYIGDIDEGEKVMLPLRKFGSPLADTIAPTSYVALNSLFDAAFPYGGMQRYWKSSFLKELGDDMIEVVVGALGEIPVADVEWCFSSTCTGPRPASIRTLQHSGCATISGTTTSSRNGPIRRKPPTTSNGPVSSGPPSSPSRPARSMSTTWTPRKPFASGRAYQPQL